MSIYAPPQGIQNTYVMEAQEPVPQTSFSHSPIGLIPLEIRLEIYKSALLIEITNKQSYSSWHHYLRPAIQVRPEWEKDHRHFGKRRQECIWPSITNG